MFLQTLNTVRSVCGSSSRDREPETVQHVCEQTEAAEKFQHVGCLQKHTLFLLEIEFFRFWCFESDIIVPGFL